MIDAATEKLNLSELDSSRVDQRHYFDRYELEKLAGDILLNGIYQPLLVMRVGARYQVVLGERRYRAAKIAGLTEVPVIIRIFGQQPFSYLELIDPEHQIRYEAMIINYSSHRHQLKLRVIEDTEAIMFLLSYRLQIDEDLSLTVLTRMKNRVEQLRYASKRNLKASPKKDDLLEEFGAKVEGFFEDVIGLSWLGFINNRLPILKLPRDVRDSMIAGMGIKLAKKIAMIEDENTRGELLERINSGEIRGYNLEKEIAKLSGLGSVSNRDNQTSLIQLAEQVKAIPAAQTDSKIKTLLDALKERLGQLRPFE